MNYAVRNLSYRYAADKPATLDNISFEILPNEITSVVGPSGSGKSTLVNILSGVIPSLIKDGKLDGALELPPDVFVGVIGQNPENQLFGYGVEDAIAFGVENMGLPSSELNERVDYVCELLNIDHLRRRSVSTLSGGQRQAVCIASVLAMRPDILVMDEPVSSLDPNGRQHVRAIISQLRASGQTMIIVDNNLDWCSGIVDHVIGLERGQVVFNGTKSAFFDDFQLQLRLGVSLPQEVELYRELKKRIPELSMFYTVEDARRELGALLPDVNQASGDKSAFEDRSAYGGNQASGYNPALEEKSALEDKSAREDNPTPEDRPAPEGKLSPDANERDAECIITVDKLSKTFDDDFRALIDIDTRFHRGKVVAIIGQNGSGKTTLARHLNGLYRPTSGRVYYRGKDTAGRSVAEIARDIILVFQHPEHMIFEENVTRELTFCARAQGIEVDDALVEAITREYGLDADLDELPVNLSMGKKHILTILSVLFSSAEVVILDEPTLGMDRRQREKLIQIVRRLRDEGRTVIIISHEIPLLFGVSDDLLVLDNGRMLRHGDLSLLALDRRLFDSINIQLPPVTRLAGELGLPDGIFSIERFIEAFMDATKGGGGVA